MKHKSNTLSDVRLSDTIIREAYEVYRMQIHAYIANRIQHKYDAEDLTQDVFVRLLDYTQMIRPETVRYFLFTIARNLVIDHIRRYYKKQEFDTYASITYAQHTTNETEEVCWANDLLSLEKRKLETLAPQRQKIYTLIRFEENTIEEIAQKMNLSERTVENHLRLGRKEMRHYIRQCI